MSPDPEQAVPADAASRLTEPDWTADVDAERGRETCFEIFVLDRQPE